MDSISSGWKAHVRTPENDMVKDVLATVNNAWKKFNEMGVTFDTRDHGP